MDSSAVPLELELRTLPLQTPAPARLSANARMLYRALCRHGVADVRELERLVGGPVTTSPPLQELQALGLVRRTEQGLVAVPRRQLIDELLGEQTELLRRSLERLASYQHRLATLHAESDTLDVAGGDQVETVTLDGRSAQGALDDPTRTARRELMALHPGGQFAPQTLEQSLRRAEASLQAGVRLRVVHQASALAHASSVDYLVAVESLGGQVRIRENLPFRMLLVDRDTAVCGSPAGAEVQDTYLLRGRRVTTLLDSIFETTWVDAVPLRNCLTDGAGHRDGATVPNGPDLSGQQITILKFLAEGETDQSIARRLGVTPRTVTRRIAEIYAALGVDSRFQAGAVAQRLGLV